MKKLAVVLAFAALGFVGCKNVETNTLDVDENLIPLENPTIDAQTSETSLDWSGVYEGIMPCADCEGIQTSIALKEDKTYVGTYTYMGMHDGDSKRNEVGSFSWTEDGSTVILTPTDGAASRYKVGENQIILLDADGQVNTGALEKMYVLKKKMD